MPGCSYLSLLVCPDANDFSSRPHAAAVSAVAVQQGWLEKQGATIQYWTGRLTTCGCVDMVTFTSHNLRNNVQYHVSQVYGLWLML